MKNDFRHGRTNVDGKVCGQYLEKPMMCQTAAPSGPQQLLDYYR